MALVTLAPGPSLRVESMESISPASLAPGQWHHLQLLWPSFLNGSMSLEEDHLSLLSQTYTMPTNFCLANRSSFVDAELLGITKPNILFHRQENGDLEML